jgi:hypothetical protein
MPRRKTVQPEPLEIITAEDGLVIEIRDAATRLIGRGEDKKFNAEEMENEVLLGLVGEMLSGDSARAETATAVLSTNKSIARHLLDRGLLSDERHARRHGARIRKHYRLLRDLQAGLSLTE